MKSLRFNRMSKIMGIMFVCAALASAFISCNNITDSQAPAAQEQQTSLAKLNGTWNSTWGEHYIIDAQNKTFTSKYDYNNAVNTAYVGNELSVVFTTSNSGYLYMKYTENSYYGASVVGKYYAVAFKDLTNNSVSLAGASKTDGQTACATLDAAKQEFTIANGYFATYSDCTK